jgi:hypothetical protein
MKMNDPGSYKKILEIRIGHKNAGFFAYVQYALNQIRYCEAHNYLPVINYDESYGNYFVDQGRGPNMWDYYFHPPCQFTWADINSRIADPGDPLTQSDVITLSDDEIRELCQNNPESIFHYTYGYWRRNPPDDLDLWYDEQRKKGQAFTAKYIRVRQEILGHVEGILRAHVDGQFLVGAHIRGTDMRYAPTVPLESYIQQLDNMVSENDQIRIFIATDQQQYIEILKKRYGDRMFFQDCLRSHNAMNQQTFKREDKSKLGEEVLIDALLLSSCDFILKCPSAVGEFAHYFNPDLDSLDLNFHQTTIDGHDFSADFVKRRSYPRGWELMRNKYRKLNWQLNIKHFISLIPFFRIKP